MQKVGRDLIEYNGINSGSITNLINFNQINLDYNFQISGEKPNIDSINKVWVDSYIEDTKVIETPIGISLEGQKATGYKLLISGDINIRVEYISGGNDLSVHTVQGTFPICNYVTLPEDYSFSSITFPYVCIEDIYCEVLNERTIYNNITIILVADVCN
ncbi:MAG: DUF3794 domain-containing protein [Romboutsia sp.]|uniref:DUF3794 domain-containing protein n=1 Tax=Romboutsia sp. TaxID=1965302 RepID=UPI003F403E72